MIDEAGILALYDARSRELIGFFTRRTGDPELALDLLSATFLIAFERRGQCHAGDRDGQLAWLFQIAATQLAGHYRRDASRARATERLASDLRALTPAEVSVFDALAAQAESPALLAALGALNPEQRRAVELRVVEEQPYEAVAHRLGITEPTARARVSRGLRALRAAIGRDQQGGNA